MAALPVRKGVSGWKLTKKMPAAPTQIRSSLGKVKPGNFAN